LNKLAIRFADAVIQGSPMIDSQIKDSIDAFGKPFLPYQSPAVYIEAYNDFYNQILEQ
jgi:starch synthase